MRTKTKIKSEVLKIRKGLFFPEDFAKLPEGTFIYVAEGALINIDEGTETVETETKEAVSEEPVKKKHKKHRKRKYTKREGVVYGGPKGPRKKAYGRSMDSKEIEKVNESEEPSIDEEAEEQPKSKYFEFPRKKVQYSDLHSDAE